MDVFDDQFVKYERQTHGPHGDVKIHLSFELLARSAQPK